LPYYGPMGDVYTLQVQMRGDGYWSDQTVGGGTPTTVNTYGFSGRAMPLAMLDWRWPFVRPGTDVNLLVEPIVNFVATPNGGNSSKIPNE
ncbi:LPS assembly protein LptD, partial [Vibrio parahaemolyticus]